MKLREKLSWAIVAMLGLFVLASMAGSVSGGTLDPPGAPAPSLRPLDEILSAWKYQFASDDGTVCASSRFTCIWNDEAVFDRETGLVWQRTVQTSAVPYGNARLFCGGGPVGGRLGWRLPATAELTSLIDPTASAAPYLPTDHPFQNVHPTDPYWTSTRPLDPAITSGPQRELVFFDYGLGAAYETGDTARYWCVRGGQGHDG
jgi:hypothetical protein